MKTKKKIYYDEFELRSILDIGDLKINSSRNHLNGTCPLCGKAKHFYINITRTERNGSWDCKHCGENGGSVIKLLKFLGKEDFSKDTKLVDLSIKLSLIEDEAEEVVELDSKAKKLPIGFKRTYNNEYLTKDRKFTDSDYLFNHCGTTDIMYSFKNYIIFPVIEDGEVKGFVGRYANKKVPSNKPRYNNSKHTDFSKLVYGIDEIDEDTKLIIVVEGIFDKIYFSKLLRKLGIEDIVVVATFGNKISDIQSKKISRKNREASILLCYDKDAISQMKKYGIFLKKNHKTVLASFSPAKDIDESDLKEIFFLIDNAVPIDTFVNKRVSLLKIKR